MCEYGRCDLLIALTAKVDRNPIVPRGTTLKFARVDVSLLMNVCVRRVRAACRFQSCFRLLLRPIRSYSAVFGACVGPWFDVTSL